MKRRSFLGYLPVFPAALSAQFDGKTLKGWSVQSGPESAFYLADGMIAASETSEIGRASCRERVYVLV